jgi:hypothetical protein
LAVAVSRLSASAEIAQPLDKAHELGNAKAPADAEQAIDEQVGRANDQRDPGEQRSKSANGRQHNVSLTVPSDAPGACCFHQ